MINVIQIVLLHLAQCFVNLYDYAFPECFIRCHVYDERRWC